MRPPLTYRLVKGHVVRGLGVGESPGEDNAGSGLRELREVSGDLPRAAYLEAP